VTADIIYEKEKITNSELEINLSGQPKSFYFVKILRENKITVHKIVIQ
jgi:hypothetical protein